MGRLVFGVFLVLLLSVAAFAATATKAANSSAEQKTGELVVTQGLLASAQKSLPVAGTKVVAYPIEVSGFSAPAPYESAPVGNDGVFSIKTPPGEYYFVAVGQQTYTFYGRNPVLVTDQGAVEVKITLADSKPIPPKVKPIVTTGVYGVVTHAGKPLADAVITVYGDLGSSFKGMGLGMSEPTKADGLFQFELPPGSYYLVARKRTGGGVMGPLQEGDFFGYFPGNPVLVKNGAVMQASIPAIEVPDKVKRHAQNMFGETRIKGKVVDSQGKPVAGFRVLLYDNPTMTNRPLFVSQPSAADGSYVISFPDGGSYWLAARKHLGGQPAPGDPTGRYLGSENGSVRVKTGEALDGVVLTLDKSE